MLTVDTVIIWWCYITVDPAATTACTIKRSITLLCIPKQST